MWKTSHEFLLKSRSVFGQRYFVPFCIKKAKGHYLYDFDGNRYVDYSLNDGSFILGHANPKVTRFIKNTVNKGFYHTVHSGLSLRLANLILKAYSPFIEVNFSFSKIELFDKLCYLIKKQSGKSILFIGDKYSFLKASVCNKSYHSLFLCLEGDINKETVIAFIKENHSKIGALYLEPLLSTLSFYKQDFWSSVQSICSLYKIKIILDEEILCFRLSFSWAFANLGFVADFVILGNVIGGGFPLFGLLGKERDAFAALNQDNKDQMLVREQPLYYTAGIETLKYIRRENPYLALESLVGSLKEKITNKHIVIRSIASIFCIYYKNNESAVPYKALPRKVFVSLCKSNIFLNPSHDARQFVSTEHKEHDIKKLASALNELSGIS